MAFKCRKIKNAVAAEFGIDAKMIDSQDRSTKIARARMVAAYLCRTTITPEISLPNIGRQFGRHHTTVLHAMRRVPELAGTHPKFAALVERCRASIADGPSPEDALRNGWHGEVRA